MATTPELTAVVLVGTLDPSPARSSSELLGRQVLDAMAQLGVSGTLVRLVDHDVRPGVELDMGPGDAWPAIRARIIAADILVLATPIWMGQPSSVCKLVLERLDAELSNTDDQGRLLTYGKVAAVAVVGNEDGAHHTTAEVFQSLNDVGYTVPASCSTYWVGEAMQGVDYRDLDPRPETTAGTTRTVAARTAHLARLLKGAPFPPAG